MAMAARELEVPQWTMGDRMRKAREYAQVSRQEMADRFGVTPGAISHWENDRQRPRDLLTCIRKWSDETKVPVQWLLGLGSDSMYLSTPTLSVVPTTERSLLTTSY